jgi:integrase
MPTYQKVWKVNGAIIRQRGCSYQVETHHNGKRTRQTFKTVEAAENYAKHVKSEIKAEGDMALAINGSQRLDALCLLEAFPTKKAQDDVVSAARLLTSQVKNYAPNKPLLAEAVRFWLSHHPQGGTLPTLNEALASYLADKRLEKRRAATLYEISHKIGRFIKAFPATSISDITTDLISQWLTDTLGSATVGTKRQYLTVISAFFTDSAKRYGLPKNPAKDVKLAGSNADQTEVQAYSVDEVRKIMTAANASPHAARVVPAMAIGFFAGLRPSEVQGLDWADVSLEAKRIRVSPETAKKRRARYVDMSDNLVEWLTPYARERGLVAPPLMTYRRARTEIMESTGCALIKDGFRHSFGTYHLAAYENAAKTAFAMGHRSDTDLVYTNYRKLVTREEGEAYWKIRPMKLLESAVTGKTEQQK